MALLTPSSFTVFAEGSHDRVDRVLRVVEGNEVACAPVELGADTGGDTILNVVFRSSITNFLVGGLHDFDLRHQVHGFEVRKHSYITDVAHSLDLIQMASIVHEVKHEVVLHRDVESLHLLSLVAAARHS